jgi:hypothetical protein
MDHLPAEKMPAPTLFRSALRHEQNQNFQEKVGIHTLNKMFSSGNGGFRGLKMETDQPPTTVRQLKLIFSTISVVPKFQRQKLLFMS